MDKKVLLSTGSSIVISRPGGTVQVSGERFQAIEPEVPLFQAGEKYIFILHLDPRTGSFKVNPSDVYLIRGDRVYEGSTHPKIISGFRDTNTFLSQIETVVASDPRNPQ